MYHALRVQGRARSLTHLLTHSLTHSLTHARGLQVKLCEGAAHAVYHALIVWGKALFLAKVEERRAHNEQAAQNRRQKARLSCASLVKAL